MLGLCGYGGKLFRACISVNPPHTHTQQLLWHEQCEYPERVARAHCVCQLTVVCGRDLSARSDVRESESPKIQYTFFSFLYSLLKIIEINEP